MVSTIRDATGGRMCASVAEAVGIDATISLALKLDAREGGALKMVLEV